MSETKSLTPEQQVTLEILQQSVFNFIKVGGRVDVKTLELYGVHHVAILLPHMDVDPDGKFSPLPQEEIKP